MKLLTWKERLASRIFVGFVIVLMIQAALVQQDNGWIGGAILFTLATLDKTFGKVRN